jgi:hypothetical protein
MRFADAIMDRLPPTSRGTARCGRRSSPKGEVAEIEAEQLGEHRPFVEGADDDDVAAVAGSIFRIELEVAGDLVDRRRQVGGAEGFYGLHVDAEVGTIEQGVDLRADQVFELGCIEVLLLRLAGADHARSGGDGPLERLTGEVNDADLDRDEEEGEEGQCDQRELDCRHAVVVAAEPAEAACRSKRSADCPEVRCDCHDPIRQSVTEVATPCRSNRAFKNGCGI